MEKHITDSLTNRGCIHLECHVMWKKPEHPRNFEDMRVLLVVTVKEGVSFKQYESKTKPNWSYEELMIEACKDFIHPSLRLAVARSLFDEHYAINKSEEYQSAREEWKAWKKHGTN